MPLLLNGRILLLNGRFSYYSMSKYKRKRVWLLSCALAGMLFWRGIADDAKAAAHSKTDNERFCSMNQKRIAICDDEEDHRIALSKCAQNCKLWDNEDVVVDAFSGGQSLLDAIGNGYKYDYAFLDINMPEINGLDLCGRILKIAQPSIIFVSTHMENQPAIDRHYPAMLLPKPYTQELFDNIVRALHARQDAMNHFEFTHNGKKQAMPCKDIYFFSMAAHHLMITTVGGTFQDASLNLKIVEREHASESFYRCHKSHIINLRYYDSHDYKNVYLNCGGKLVQIRLSKGKGSDLKAAYLKKIVGGNDAF